MELVLVRLEVAELGEGFAGARIEVGVCGAPVEAALEAWARRLLLSVIDMAAIVVAGGGGGGCAVV